MRDPHARRRAALRTTLRARDVDALLIVDLLNIRYLTGFTGSNAALVVHAEDEERTVFCTDGRYLTQSAAEGPDLERVLNRQSAPALAERIGTRAADYRRPGFQGQHVTWDGLDGGADPARRDQPARTPGTVR